ncbi:hypothetical protein EBGED10_27200 [Bacillus sp. GeD10]|nr:hypothetical protein EBGED10_27200 [Bacillus sp. GeD10]
MVHLCLSVVLKEMTFNWKQNNYMKRMRIGVLEMVSIN